MERLRDAIKEIGIEVERLSEMTDITQNRLKSIMDGKEVRGSELRKISICLNVSADYLLGRKTAKK